MKLYIVQAEFDGIPDEPTVCFEQEQADKVIQAFYAEYGFANEAEMWEDEGRHIRSWVVDPPDPWGFYTIPPEWGGHIWQVMCPACLCEPIDSLERCPEAEEGS